MNNHIFEFDYDKYGNTKTLVALAQGTIIQSNNYLNKGTAFTTEERSELGLVGALPPSPRPLEMQVINSAEKVQNKSDDIERFIYIRSLFDRNVTLAHALIKCGLEKQDRAAIYLENSSESVISIFGILKASGVFVVINPQVKAKKVEYILNDCQVKTLITDKKHLQEVSDNLSNCPNLESIALTDEQEDIESIAGSLQNQKKSPHFKISYRRMTGLYLPKRAA